ncbi:outer membrane beta-barrel protein [Massilia sp. Dwa41.01b]|uniref:outer membrane beta-barrel protein n=1 Tax=unclassified Massilia TaxID=2609279 RepID=UPI001600D411|nr:MULTISPECIES: outer membrane beta-barrel protein [unclassified Massilia]QNA89152.1 outer membrane beta-barrel protein [Massilia sp. Dwa41.01b]QNB00045.1 outer membrane beta-barrel protein [Massilia sp. Se16.2.3]
MFKQIAAAAALVIASSSAFAQQAPKFYVGADVTSTKAKDTDGNETGYGAFAGYKFNENFAIEGGLRRLADISDTYYDDYYDVDMNEKVKLNQTSIAVIGTLPLSSGFGIYGRLGYNHVKAKYRVTASSGGFSASEADSYSENKVVYGAGLTYSFTPAIVGRLEVQKPVSDLTTVVAGVSFGF